ncbi:helix-turn-helix domain-containing protein [Kovacikia minuta CCNUW1]|uniref:TniQ family protein n=1 Tax=Kovacikia minuta TaxID=2931930 RepID=UPI001CCA0A07|nr:TniQ family protein [Kovacikia minuta]UBF29548.1 helix-turn-helix domain-containing protein [Kovacikia minuta CCNUW1]
MKSCTGVLNSTGQMAWDFVHALENLTLRHDLRYLTLVQWANILPAKGLLRHSRVWCSACYKEWQRNQRIVYEPLLWSFSVVSICQQHQRKLSSICPFCQHELSPLSWHSQPGYCSKCHCWLGDEDTISVQEIDSGELKWQAWVIKNVGELLAYTSHLSDVPVRGQVARALAACISQTTQGNITEFARKLGLLKSAVWQWQSSKALPQLLVILKICYALEISLLEFLFDPEILGTGKPTIKAVQNSSPKFQHHPVQFDTPKVQKSLEDVLLEEPPPSMESVAKRFKISARSMRRRFPQLCTAISNRYLKHREKLREAKIEQSCAEVRQIAIKLYNKGIDPTRNYISGHLSKPAYFREPSVSAALTSLRKELGLEES